MILLSDYDDDIINDKLVSSESGPQGLAVAQIW